MALQTYSCISVCLSIYLSVTLVYCVKVNKDIDFVFQRYFFMKYCADGGYLCVILTELSGFMCGTRIQNTCLV